MTTKTLEEISASPVSTGDPMLKIDQSGRKLSVGGHSFQLEVQDDSGNVSSPTQVLLIVVDTQAPTAVLTVRDENGLLLPGNRIEFGKEFILDGSRSVDIGGGSIVKYTWTLVE